MNKQPYNIGLDIGTSSVGWSATELDNRLLHIKGHNGIGVRLLWFVFLLLCFRSTSF